MSNFPNQIDDDVSIPRVDDNLEEIGGTAINALRDATFAIENVIGIGAPGTAGSIAARLGVSLDSAGNIKASALTGLGLVTLPITNSQVSATAGIQESKLALDYNTANLFNSISNVKIDVNNALGFINLHGVKIEPHIDGSNYRHIMNQIDVDTNVNNYFKDYQGLLRNNSNLYNLFKDINDDFVTHQKADSTDFGLVDPTSTSVGTIPPKNYAHNSSGIFLNTSNFSFIPQTATDLQQFAQFIDNSNIFILGTRIQTLYQNGISRTSRATAVGNTVGQLIVPLTTATTYLLNGGSSSPVDNIDTGDDIIEFTPDNSVVVNNVFDSQFALVQVGNIVTINYGSVITSFIIREVKYVVNGGNKRYLVRINGKNLLATTAGKAQINKQLFNTDKYGVLALAQAQPPSPVGNSYSTLIAGNPRGAEVLGINFNADLIDSQHYNLYLVLYPTGSPNDSIYSLAAIDVSGNQGQTPGKYTLDSIVESMNAAFRTPGFNYRFIAFQYQGNIGLMLADSFKNASFSIISGILATNGSYDQTASNTVYPNNVVGLFDGKDALGFGPGAANVASPPYAVSFASSLMSQTPTKIFVPLSRKTFYVNGVEREKLNLEPHQLIDSDGDGYWPATIVNKTIIGPRVQVTYQVNQDLSVSGLQIGKTIVAQQEADGTSVDFGRFFIENIQFDDCNCDGYNAFTKITVYDAIHGTGVTPFASSAVGTKLRLYFSGDSIGVNTENLSDATSNITYKRHFEYYINQDGYTFAQERGRMNISGSNITVNGITLYSTSTLSLINIVKISPKLRGYAFNSIRKISLQITDYNVTTGIFDGYLANYNGTAYTNNGPIVTGKKGQVTRFYDETNVDYIDFIFDINDSISAIGTTNTIDIQLFPTLSLDDEVMLLGTCQINDITKKISYLRDARQFGNTSEVQLTTSALDYIAAPTKLLSENGIIRGFDIVSGPSGDGSSSGNEIFIKGGTAIVNGKIINMNNTTVAVPTVVETIYPAFVSTVTTITWFICVNDKSEIELIASTDFDPNGGSATLYNTANVDHNRIFYVINPSLTSPTPYSIRSGYLNDIVSNQRDITPIALVTTTVSGSAISPGATVKDLRRFIGGGYAGLTSPLVLGPNSSFRNFTSLNAFLDQLLSYKSAQSFSNSIGTKVIVKGNNNITSTVTLSYASEVIFEGDGGTFNISSAIGFSLGNNVKFKNLKVNYTYDPIASSDGAYSSLVLSNPSKAAIYCNVDTTNGNKNISFENCTFTSSLQNRFGFIGFNLSATGSTLENVSIINNKFQTSFGADDKRAVITFIGPTTTPSNINGARLINCLIDGNNCNKNQLILISSAISGANVLDAITPINVQITRNICGAICYLMKEDTPFSIANTAANKDKLQSLVIKQNICKFIYCGLANGMTNDSSGNTAITLLNTGLFTPFVNISENSVSWIQVGLRVPTLSSQQSGTSNQNSPLIIKNNKLTAYNFSYQNDYFTIASPPTVNNAITINKVAGT